MVARVRLSCRARSYWSPSSSFPSCSTTLSTGNICPNSGCSTDTRVKGEDGDGLMLAAVRMTISLLKVRIGVAVAASALAGMAAANGPVLAWWQSVGLALAVLGASGAAGAFNHYYERDLDQL